MIHRLLKKAIGLCALLVAFSFVPFFKCNAEEAVTYKQGDVNNDNRVNSSDSIYLARALAKWPGYDVTNNVAADVNNDGKINSADSIYLARALAKWPGYTLEEPEQQGENFIGEGMYVLQYSNKYIRNESLVSEHDQFYSYKFDSNNRIIKIAIQDENNQLYGYVDEVVYDDDGKGVSYSLHYRQGSVYHIREEYNELAVNIHGIIVNPDGSSEEYDASDFGFFYMFRYKTYDDRDTSYEYDANGQVSIVKKTTTEEYEDGVERYEYSDVYGYPINDTSVDDLISEGAALWYTGEYLETVRIDYFQGERYTGSQYVADGKIWQRNVDGEIEEIESLIDNPTNYLFYALDFNEIIQGTDNDERQVRVEYDSNGNIVKGITKQNDFIVVHYFGTLPSDWPVIESKDITLSASAYDKYYDGLPLTYSMQLSGIDADDEFPVIVCRVSFIDSLGNESLDVPSAVGHYIIHLSGDEKQGIYNVSYVDSEVDILPIPSGFGRVYIRLFDEETSDAITNVLVSHGGTSTSGGYWPDQESNIGNYVEMIIPVDDYEWTIHLNGYNDQTVQFSVIDGENVFASVIMERMD